jgi:hypothetical protein
MAARGGPSSGPPCPQGSWPRCRWAPAAPVSPAPGLCAPPNRAAALAAGLAKPPTRLLCPHACLLLAAAAAAVRGAGAALLPGAGGAGGGGDAGRAVRWAPLLLGPGACWAQGNGLRRRGAWGGASRLSSGWRRSQRVRCTARPRPATRTPACLPLKDRPPAFRRAAARSLVVTQLHNKLSRTLKQLLRALPGDVLKVSEASLAAGLALAHLPVLHAGGMQQAEALLSERATMISELQAAHNSQVGAAGRAAGLPGGAGPRLAGCAARRRGCGGGRGDGAATTGLAAAAGGGGRVLSRGPVHAAGGARGARRARARPRARPALQRQVRWLAWGCGWGAAAARLAASPDVAPSSTHGHGHRLMAGPRPAWPRPGHQPRPPGPGGTIPTRPELLPGVPQPTAPALPLLPPCCTQVRRRGGRGAAGHRGAQGDRGARQVCAGGARGARRRRLRLLHLDVRGGGGGVAGAVVAAGQVGSVAAEFRVPAVHPPEPA